MAYTPVTQVNSPSLAYFQWAQPLYPFPMLASDYSATDTTISFTVAPRDHTGAIITGNFLFGMEKANGYTETAYVPASGMSVDGLTATGVIRGIRLDGLDVTTGDSTLAVAHLADEPVFCNISATLQAITVAALTAGIGSNIMFDGRNLFMGSGLLAARVFSDATARDAAIVSPQNGDQCYLTSTGQFNDYQGGSWQARANGVNPNGSTSVAGKFQEATQAQNDSGTQTGGTGADLVGTPLENARSVQKGIWFYGVDTGAANAYVATLTPAPTAYAAGMEVNILIANGNTGASTINLNALGVKSIVDINGTALLLGDMPAGGIAKLIYNGSFGKFQLMNVSLSGVGFASADGQYTTGTLGDAVSASDITNNLNLVYQSLTDMKWYKVTSVTSTQWNTLGLVAEAGIANATVRILLKGQYSNQTFANINPTFSSALTGTDVTVGRTTADDLVAFKVDNSTGAECVVTGGTISAKQTGTPTGAMEIYLVLEQQDQANTPAAFRDDTNNVARGAIIGSATIAQALFSGTYASLSFSFGANVKIPAGQKVYLVVGKAAGASNANYYNVQSSVATAKIESTTQTWSGTANAGNLTLTVTSTSPIGYGVKAYSGTSGNYSLTPTTAWSRVIGTVLSATSFMFNPTNNQSFTNYGKIALGTTFANVVDLATLTTSFCPNTVQIQVTEGIDANVPLFYYLRAYLRGDGTNAATSEPDANGYAGGTNAPINWNDISVGSYTATLGPAKLFLMGTTAALTSQNRTYLLRLENGFYMYCGFPSGTGFISAGVAGYASSNIVFQFSSAT